MLVLIFGSVNSFNTYVFDEFRFVRNSIEELGEVISKYADPFTKRRMLVSSFFLYLCYYPSRYLSGPHNSALFLL